MSKRLRLTLGIAAFGVAFAIGGAALAQQQQNIAIATGGTGGVYYPMGGGMANVLSKHLPGIKRPRGSPADRSTI